MIVEIDKDSFFVLCLCALRYCEGRRTYMPHWIQSIVLAHKDCFDYNNIRTILSEEEFQEDCSLWGDDCDRKDWEDFYKEMRKELHDRFGV